MGPGVEAQPDRGGRRGVDNRLAVESSRPELTPNSLVAQYRFILDKNRGYNQLLERDTRRPDSDYAYLDRFFRGFFEDRIKRSREIKSDTYQEVVGNFKRNIFSNKPVFVIGCIDGRDIAVHKGLPADTVATYRVAGGDPAGFNRDTDGVYRLNAQSNFYGELKREMLTTESEAFGIFWGGAHIGCAAGEGKQRGIGAAKDSGLHQSVRDRVQMIEATKRRLALDRDLTGRTAIFMPHVFNVNNGHTYWGMEKPDVLEASRDSGYTVEVLDQLAQDGTIISTKQLVQDNAKILALFRSNVMRLDWENDYTGTAQEFTNRVLLMKDELLPIMQEAVTRLYPRPIVPKAIDITTKDGRNKLREHTQASELYDHEIEMRAVGLMQSAYAGFLNNLPHEGALEFDLQALKAMQEGENYRYKIHKEEGIKASAGIYPPYTNEMFAVAVGEPRLPGNVKIANEIVRKDRADGTVTDSEITDPIAFSHAPVPLVVKELAEGISETDWERYQTLDFTDLIDLDWHEWTTAEHLSYLQRKGVEVPDQIMRFIRVEGAPAEIPDKKLGDFIQRFEIDVPPIVTGLENLRKDMVRLYQNHVTRDLLIDNHILAMPALGDDKREPRMVIPYIKLGVTVTDTEIDD